MGFTVPAMQVAIMFGLIALGWMARRLHLVGAESSKGMTNLLLYLVSPAVIVQALQRPFDPGRLRTVGLVFALDVVSFVITIAVVQLVFNARLVPDIRQRTALKFGSIYTNAGFIGIPLAQALLGDDGVFYAIAYIAVFNLFVWTHGIGQFGPSGQPLRQRLGRALINPNVAAIGVGLILFGFSLRLPSPLFDVLGYLAAMNTPLSMLVIGATLAGYGLRTVFSDWLVWLGVAVRNLALPLLFVLLLWWVPLDHVARLAMLISISAPVGASLVIFSLKHDWRPEFPSRFLAVSTLCSVVSLPLVLVVAGLLW